MQNIQPCAIVRVMEKVRVRIAPSPTGWFHIGTARTALFNYVFAKKHAGKFILRLEDTDIDRNDKKYEQDILEGMHWLGLNYDEGPYKQSERLEIYKKEVDRLLKEGKAYYCACTKEELEAAKKAALEAHEPYVYSGRCRGSGEKMGAVRLKVNSGMLSFADIIRGEIKQEVTLIGDMVIVRSDGTPLYNLTVAVDDVDMKISHVIRGDDHISNTFKQILIQKALGYGVPKYAHLPLIVNADRSKMSKRRDPVSVTRDFRDKGYLPEALINYMALLGWAPGDNREFLGQNEIITEFELKKVQKSAAAWSQQKLDNINGHYIRKLTPEEFVKKAQPFAKNATSTKLKQIAPLVQERVQRLNQIEEVAGWAFTDDVNINAEDLIPKKGKPEKIKIVLAEAEKFFKKADWNHEVLEKGLRALAGRLDLNAGMVLWPVRYALTGARCSPGVFEVLLALGREKSLERIKKAIIVL